VKAFYIGQILILFSFKLASDLHKTQNAYAKALDYWKVQRLFHCWHVFKSLDSGPSKPEDLTSTCKIFIN
jgi:hypothetical protein